MLAVLHGGEVQQQGRKVKRCFLVSVFDTAESSGPFPPKLVYFSPCLLLILLWLTERGGWGLLMQG